MGGGVFRVRAVGDRACIVEALDLERVLGVASRLRRLAIAGVVDIVPAARTVLVRCEDRAAVRRVERAVAAFEPVVVAEGGPGREVTIDVVYDGEDLAAVGALTGLGAESVVAAHTGAVWRAAFGGFAPGFVYLVGGDPRLETPRLETPRIAVPAGAVAVAGGFSAVYPRESPGGWRLLGRTAQRMWDAGRDRPALVVPGDTVRFRAVRELLAVPGPRGRDAGPAGLAAAALTVVDPGPLALVEDAGRPGHAALGVTESGALDRAALRRANLAVGNEPDAAGIESLNGGLVLRAERETLVAVTGGDAEARIEERDRSAVRTVEPGRPVALLPGETLRLGAPAHGLRCYVAARGGIAAAPVLGSGSHDSLSGLGPAPLRAGDRLSVGADPGGDAREVPEPAPEEGAAVLRFVPGPREDWFTAGSAAAFASRTWRVTPRSDRIGLRLEGEPLERERSGELPTEGMVGGSVQVPPDGLPVLFLADHPVTGGYPVIGTVVDADLDRAAQLRPGDGIRFVPVDPDDIGAARGAAALLPERVSFSMEIDGRRYGVTVPAALALALEGALATGDGSSLAAILHPLVVSILAQQPGSAAPQG